MVSTMDYEGKDWIMIVWFDYDGEDDIDHDGEGTNGFNHWCRLDHISVDW